MLQDTSALSSSDYAVDVPSVTRRQQSSGGGATSSDSPRSVNTGAMPSSRDSSSSAHPPGAQAARWRRAEADWGGGGSASLCDRIAAMSKRYVDDGEAIRRQVMTILAKCRQVNIVLSAMV